MRVTFPQFAFNNVCRNGRAYFAYFLSTAFMVMIFFTYAVFIYHPAIQGNAMGAMAKTAMGIATGIVYVFAFFFVLFSISAFLKSRNREFGILTILGAKPSQINLLILLENMLIGGVAIISGIASGLLLSKLFLLIITKVIDMNDLPFYWPGTAMLLTAAAFAILFLCISLFTLLFINRSQVLALLTGSSKPKKEPKANLLLALLGTALLATGYAALRVNGLTSEGLIVAAISGIAGTYFFYSQLSVWAVRLLQKSRKRSWKGTHLLWISEMSYKLKDNARMLFLVTVVTALACMTSGFVLANQQSLLANFRSNPFAITYAQYEQADKTSADAEVAEIDSKLQQAGLSYKRISVELLWCTVRNSADYGVTVISRAHYNEFAALMNAVPAGAVNEQEAILIQTPEGAKTNVIAGDTVELAVGNSSRGLRYTTRTERLAAAGTKSRLLVVNDALYQALRSERVTRGVQPQPATLYALPESAGIPAKRDPESVVGTQLVDWNRMLAKQGQNHGFIESRAESYYSQKQAMDLFTFIGVFIALIFSISSASFLYFKLHTELAADRIMYRALSKIGLSSREMNQSATLQIAVLFFIPIAAAAVQALVVLDPILTELEIPYVRGPVFIASSVFLAAQSIYFFIVRARYLKSVNSMMV